MNKLGFAIKRASQGAGNVIECNKGQWTNKVVDIREYLKLFNGLQGTDNIVTFMSFDEGGCFLTQLRAISGRVGDFLSGWIYIPNTIEASGEQIFRAYDYVRGILSQSNLFDLKDDIESFFSKEYPSKEVVAQYVASKGQLYGVRYLGHYSLKEIVGEDRYQPYYSGYKAIFLLNKDGEVTIPKETENNFSDFTDRAIVKTSILVPPTKESLQNLGEGTKIYTTDGSVFNRPLLVYVNSKISLILSRAGFEDKKLEVNVISERQNIDLSKVNITWEKKIATSMFTVRNSNRDKIKGVRISVNDTDITFQDVRFSEEKCRQALVKVSAPGYEDYEQLHSLLNGNLDITLNRKVMRAEVELSNGRSGEMAIKSEYLPSNSNSPLKGYEYYNGGKSLKLSSWFVWKQRLWGFFAALVGAILIIAYTAFDDWSDTHHIKFKFGFPPIEVITVSQDYTAGPPAYDDTKNQDQGKYGQNGLAETSLEKAISYLDNHSTWTKSKMETYPGLKGLFDDMNNFDLDKILNEWAGKLSASKNFSDIRASAQKALYKAWNPKQSPHTHLHITILVMRRLI